MNRRSSNLGTAVFHAILMIAATLLAGGGSDAPGRRSPPPCCWSSESSERISSLGAGSAAADRPRERLSWR